MTSPSTLTPEEQKEKEEFVKQHREYGYSGRLDGIHAAEFASRLGDSVYLDHAGSGLYTASHLASTHEYLSRALLLNPHSDPATAAIVDSVRERVLKHLGVSARTHSVVFTYNVSTALALLGSSFPFSASGTGTDHSQHAPAATTDAALGSELALLMDNHNSVLGLRERVKALGRKGARFSLLRPRDWDPTEAPSPNAKELECCCSDSLLEQFNNGADAAAATACPPSSSSSAAAAAVHPCLFVFPAESNFDGRVYDASLASRLREYNHPHPLPAVASDAQRDVHAAASAAATAACTSNTLSLHHVGPSFRWYSALDASKYLCSSPLNLHDTPADFVLMSFYKMFGFPTGLAALVVRKEAARELWGADLAVGAAVAAAAATSAVAQTSSNPLAASGSSTAGAAISASSSSSSSSSSLYPSLSSLRGHFSGGTVNAVVANEDFHVLRSSGRLHELLEDGTVAFTSIVALPYGFDLFDSLGVHRGAITAHCRALTEHLFEWLSAQQHEEGRPLCVFYGERARVAQQLRALKGDALSAATAASSRHPPRFNGVLNLNFLDRRGAVLGYKTVEKVARVQGVYLRSGSFCNPGACQLSFPLSAAQIRTNVAAGYACWEEGENLGGVTNGSVRLSVGWCTRFEDIARFKRFVHEQIRPLGMHQFVSAGDAAAAGATATATKGAAAAAPSPIRQEVLSSPFDYQLPAHFRTVVAVTPTTTQNDASASEIPRDDATAPAAPSAAAYAASSLAVAPVAPIPSSPFMLTLLCFYPIKSCSGISLPRWWVQQTLQQSTADKSVSPARWSSTLFLDREFVLLDAHGVALSQKLLPKLQLLVPSIDVRARSLTLRAPELEPLVISLDESVDQRTASASSTSAVASLCSLQVCGQSSLGFVYDDPQAHGHIFRWLTRAVGQDTVLARKSRTIRWPDDDAIDRWEKEQQTTMATTARGSDANHPHSLPSATNASQQEFDSVMPSPSPAPLTNPSSSSSLSSSAASVRLSAPGTSTAPLTSPSVRQSFANEEDFLLVNAASVREVGARLRKYVASHATLRPVPADEAAIPPTRFRPNFVVDSARVQLEAFAEDTWTFVRVGPFKLQVKGGCARCTMVNVDPATATRQSALFALLHTCRRSDKGKVLFGSLLSQLTVDDAEGRRQQPQQPAPQQTVRWWPIHVGMPCSAE